MNMGTGTEEKKSARTQAREAFFLEFATTIRRELPDVPLMVTGGFRTRKGADAAVREEGCDLVGIARPAAVNPLLPKEVLLNVGMKEVDAAIRTQKPQPSWIMNMLGLRFLAAASDTVSCSLLDQACRQHWN
jgi:2,4-dienoyl-CoA reductase-like NADH-dependent reductase (Old Yellow Enzyme family)